jgi:uncharacterized protein (TIGR00725 family)
MNYSICISGAAGGHTVDQDRSLAERLGTAVAKKGHVVTTGAVVGLPYFAARAARKAGGMSIGFSPAASLREHLHKYRLPIGVFDFINFTGMHYIGRDVFLVQSSDAVITIGGRFGSLHEFTTAILSDMPCGVLTGSGGAADKIQDLMNTLETSHRKLVVFDDDPERLVAKLIGMLDKDYADVDVKDELTRWYLDDPSSSTSTPAK